MKKETLARTLKIIRKYCLDCCCNSPKEVRLCTIPDCALYNFRFGTIIDKRIKLPFLLKKINEECVECCSGNKEAAKYCTFDHCALNVFVNSDL